MEARLRILEGRRSRLQERLDRVQHQLELTQRQVDRYAMELQRHGVESVEREVRWLSDLINAERRDDGLAAGRRDRPKQEQADTSSTRHQQSAAASETGNSRRSERWVRYE